MINGDKAMWVLSKSLLALFDSVLYCTAIRRGAKRVIYGGEKVNELSSDFAYSTEPLEDTVTSTDPGQGPVDAYFSADVETDGPIPGPYSMLSFALVFAGTYDGKNFRRPQVYDRVFYSEIKPISAEFEEEALRVNGLDRDRLILEGEEPASAMVKSAKWVQHVAGNARPVLVAYPLSFDWTWLYWYFVRYCPEGSPFDYSRCFDIKTAFAVKAGLPISRAGRGRLPSNLASHRPHTHHAVDDAIEQAEIFGNIFEWEGEIGGMGKP
jgi:hypothetical protein